MRPITISLAPNTQSSDAKLAFSLLFQPWRWRRGGYQRKLRDQLGEIFGQDRKITLVSSGRWALFLLLKSMKLPQNSEVLVQAYTCVSAAGPILWAGLKPVYVDIHPSRLTMDPEDLKRKITPRCKAIIVQHTFGIPAPMTELNAIAKDRGLTVIEDCAHTIGGELQGKVLGTWGDATILSFGRDKAISGVFGGAMVVSNSNAFPAYDESIKELKRVKLCWIKQQLLHPILMTWVIKPLYFKMHLGKILLVALQKLKVMSKALVPQEKSGGKPPFPPTILPNALAALASYQLSRLDQFNAHRQILGDKYHEALQNTSAVLPEPPPQSKTHYLRYTIQVPHAEEIIRKAKENKFLLDDWYQVLAPKDANLASLGYFPGSCPTAEKAGRESLNLPTYPSLKTEEAEQLISYIKKEL